MISQITQESSVAQTTPIVQKQDTPAIQPSEQQKTPAPQKDSVTLSPEAKNLAAQTSAIPTQQQIKGATAVSTQEGGLVKLFQ
jgi:hypothetical protein